jgi:hypothetical protein
VGGQVTAAIADPPMFNAAGPLRVRRVVLFAP